MERDYLELIKKAEWEAAKKIDDAKIRAAEIEKDGIRRADEYIETSRRKLSERREARFSDEGYRIKKNYDNKKAILTVAINDKKIKAETLIDKAAGTIVERIIGG